MGSGVLHRLDWAVKQTGDEEGGIGAGTAEQMQWQLQAVSGLGLVFQPFRFGVKSSL